MTHVNSSCCVPLSQEDGEREKEMALVECDKGETDEVILKMFVEYTLYVDDSFRLPQLVISIYYDLLL